MSGVPVALILDARMKNYKLLHQFERSTIVCFNNLLNVKKIVVIE